MRLPKITTGFKTCVSGSQICYITHGSYYPASLFFLCLQRYLLWSMYSLDCPSCFVQQRDFLWHPTVICGFSSIVMTRVVKQAVICPCPESVPRTAELLALVTPSASALLFGGLHLKPAAHLRGSGHLLYF